MLYNKRLRKPQSLGKYLNENMSKAACLAIILAYAMEEDCILEEEKVYIDKRLVKKKCIWAR